MPKDAQHIGYFRPEQNSEKQQLPEVVPFEWLAGSHSNSKRILVLWLNEEILAGSLLQKLSNLISVQNPQVVVKGEVARRTIRIIGPQTSDTLLKMVEDAQSNCRPEVQPDSDQNRRPAPNDIEFYASSG